MEVVALLLLAVLAGRRWTRRRRRRAGTDLALQWLVCGPPQGHLRRRRLPVVQFGPPPLPR